MTARKNHFEDMLKIDVSAHVEQKGKFDYLSWPYAVAELCKADPAATWEVKSFNGLPFAGHPEIGYFVEVSVTAFGVTRTQNHPVLNHQNKTILKPNAYDINTAIMRCLVKAIALHGLGLNIYAGEDLANLDDPSAGKPEPKPQQPMTRISGAASPAVVNEIEAAATKPELDAMYRSMSNADRDIYMPWFLETAKKFHGND